MVIDNETGPNLRALPIVGADARLMDHDTTSAKRCPCPTDADLSLRNDCRLAKVEVTVLNIDLVGVGRLTGLGHAVVKRRTPAGEFVEQECVPKRDESRAQMLKVFLRVDLGRRARKDRPGVKSRLETHQADAGNCIAGEDRAFDRSSTSPARQQREVDVDQSKMFEYVTFDQLAIGNDDAKFAVVPENITRSLADLDATFDRE